MLENYNFSENRSRVDNIEEWFLMSAPTPVFSILITYLGFVIKFGPALMRKRSPFELRIMLVVYNILQVIISLFVFYIATDLLLQNGLIIQRKCITDDMVLKMKTASIIHYYFLAKVSELLDTIFFVLRKRYRQVSFLHVYHHTFTVLCSWSILKYELSYSIIFLCAINSFVHIIMYAYYGLSAFPQLTKYLWWKKYITKMQLVQFFLMVVQMVLSQKLSSCKTSHVLLAAVISNILLFMYLFAKFYVEQYRNKNTKSLNNTTALGVTNINDTNKIKKNNLDIHTYDHEFVDKNE